MLQSLFVEPLDSWSDADLAQSVSDSSGGPAPEAEAELFRRFAPRVRLYGLRHLRDEQAAADLVQHIILLTIENLRAGRVRNPDQLASFILGSCRLAVLNLRRGEQRRRRLLESFAREAATVETPNLDPIHKERLAGCLDALNERERSIIVLSFYDDCSAADVATAFGLASDHVRVIRHRALQRIRRCMESKQQGVA